MSGTLYLVATPIGNLSDITLHALDVLRQVDCILAEDTRVTLKLLNHYQIQKKLVSYSEHASDDKIRKILDELSLGKSYALVSDAGTPAISDPGAILVQEARQAGFAVVPIVGASAVSAIVSVFGARSPFFHFWGFWPQKTKKRKQLLEYFTTIPGIHVFFESPFRILKVLQKDFLPLKGKMLVGRELTKKFESFYEGEPAEVLAEMAKTPVKGEVVVAFAATPTDDAADE